ncbi:MAG: nonstructural protein [Microvirus sp.]|nr:MAG: nonstructural protein [Microvirus sp.]
MSLLKIFSVRDAKAGFFHPPRILNTHAEAEREFSTLVNDDKTMLGLYPTDHDLYYLGEFDKNTGRIIGLDSPQHMHNGISFQKANALNQQASQPGVMLQQ